MLKDMEQGLMHIRVHITILQETKVMGGQHTRRASGYTVLATIMPSVHQGGFVLMWEKNHPSFEVEWQRYSH